MSFRKQEDLDCFFWLKKLQWRHSTEQISYSKENQQTGRGGQSKCEDKCHEQLCDRSWARLLLPTEHKESIVTGPGPLIPAHRKKTHSGTCSCMTLWVQEKNKGHGYDSILTAINDFLPSTQCFSWNYFVGSCRFRWFGGSTWFCSHNWSCFGPVFVLRVLNEKYISVDTRSVIIKRCSYINCSVKSYPVLLDCIFLQILHF